jgi:hypothetical protein
MSIEQERLDFPASVLSAGSRARATSAPRPRQALISELSFLGCIYLGTIAVSSMFIAACGPGCCYIFYSIIAAVSGFLMLRQSFTTRGICLVVLLLSLFGMWHEKEVRDTWGQRMLSHQVERLQQQLQKSETK